MTPATLARIGRALYGNSWQRELSRALAIGERAVRHYAAGSRPIPESMTLRCAALLAAKADNCNALCSTLTEKETHT